MRYDDQLRRWEVRRRTIADHYAQSGSLRATGKAFGISGERVRQIVNMKEGNGQNGEDHARGSDPTPAAGTEQRG